MAGLMNPQNSRLERIWSTNWRSLLIEQNTRSSSARISFSGAIEARPVSA
jgi:cell division protein FtsL